MSSYLKTVTLIEQSVISKLSSLSFIHIDKCRSSKCAMFYLTCICGYRNYAVTRETNQTADRNEKTLDGLKCDVDG